MACWLTPCRQADITQFDDLHIHQSTKTLRAKRTFTMALLSLHDIALSFGAGPLLAGVNLQIEPGERLCLLGRNGAGKSTLMKIIEGSLRPDGGTIARQPGVLVALLSQTVPAGLAGTIRDIVAAHVPERSSGPPVVDIVLSKMQLEPEANFASLSVGLKRRALLARALATEPDVLLLDEPTNHLDIEAIEWLEAFLLKRRGSLVFSTRSDAGGVRRHGARCQPTASFSTTSPPARSCLTVSPGQKSTWGGTATGCVSDRR